MLTSLIKTRRHAFVLALSLTLAAGTTTQAGQGEAEVTLGSAAVLGGGAYSTGGGISVAVEPRNSNGRLALCGIWAQSDRLIAVLRHSARDVIAKGNITVNGRTVVRDLRFLKRAEPAQSYAGAVAGCTLTNLAWQPDPRIEIRIPRQLVYVNRSRDGGIEIRYGPSETANPALTSGSVFPSTWTSIKSKGGRYGADRPTQ